MPHFSVKFHKLLANTLRSDIFCLLFCWREVPRALHSLLQPPSPTTPKAETPSQCLPKSLALLRDFLFIHSCLTVRVSHWASIHQSFSLIMSRMWHRSGCHFPHLQIWNFNGISLHYIGLSLSEPSVPCFLQYYSHIGIWCKVRGFKK